MYPGGGYGFEFDKGVGFRYWPGDDEDEAEADAKSDAVEEVFDLDAAYRAAGIEGAGEDGSDAFVRLLLHELGVGGSAV